MFPPSAICYLAENHQYSLMKIYMILQKRVKTGRFTMQWPREHVSDVLDPLYECGSPKQGFWVIIIVSSAGWEMKECAGHFSQNATQFFCKSSMIYCHELADPFSLAHRPFWCSFSCFSISPSLFSACNPVNLTDWQVNPYTIYCISWLAR